MSTAPEVSSLRSNSVAIKQESPKMFKYYIKLSEKDKEYQQFDSTGKETILNMVGRILKEKDSNRKPCLDWLLFKCVSDGSYINIGLPVRALSEEEHYECTFKPKQLEKKFIHTIRHYEVKDFNENWTLPYFNVKFESNKHNLVSDLQRSLDVVRVNYFPGETLFEALVKDGRFLPDNLRKSDFMDENDSKVFLTSQATQHTFRITKRKYPNPELPSGETLTEPSNPDTIKQESVFPTQQHVAASNTPIVKEEVQVLPKHYAQINQYFTTTYKISLKRENEEEKEKVRKRKLEKFSKKHFQNFALNYEHQISVSVLEQVLNLKHSVGVVIAQNNKGDEFPMGTCFRIGEQFVLTNYHVWENIEKYKLNLHCVDFSYKEEGYSFLFDSETRLVFSKELDYAILRLHLDQNTFLPNSLTDSEYSIASPNFQLPENQCLTLMGHPGGNIKQIDISCPLKPPNATRRNIFTLHRVSIEESHTARYDVSTFFEGSSGSPGLLMSQKKLVVLHCRGYPLPQGGARHRFEVEEGILMSSIVVDVLQQKIEGNENLSNIDLDNIFGPLDWDVNAYVSDRDEDMSVDEDMSDYILIDNVENAAV